jgi:type III restriction enzyme
MALERDDGMSANQETDIQTVNPAALEPLFEPWEEPRAHRVRNTQRGQRAVVVPNRRPSEIAIVQNVRREVGQWREAGYPSASDTTRQLLTHWFERSGFRGFRGHEPILTF